MQSGGDSLVVAIFGAAVLVGAAMAVVQGLESRRRTALIRAAIEANQPEVAQALLATRWSTVAVRALVIAAMGVAVLIMGAVRPVELGGLIVFGAMMLVGAVPVLIYAALRGRGDNQTMGSGCVLVAASALGVAVVVLGLWLLVPAVSRREALQQLADGQDFSARVWRLTGSRVGTANPVIDGHRAEPCLWGNSNGMQICGSHYHKSLRFATVKPSYLNVFYIPATDQYLVIGTARVEPAGKVVTDGFISAKEALQPPSGIAPR